MTRLVRVLLVRPPPIHHVTIFPQKTFPLGIMGLAASVRAAMPCAVRLVDCFEGDTLDDVVDISKSFAPDVIGLSGMTAHAYDAMVLAERLRAVLPGALIVAGGIHFGAVPDETLRVCPAIDLIVAGEGEATFVELVAAVRDDGWSGDSKQFHSIAGLAYLDGDGPTLHADGAPRASRALVKTAPRKQIRDLGTLPSPAFDLISPDRYRLRPLRWNDMAMIEGSRGCPHACTWCHTTAFWENRWRPRPIEAVLDDVVACIDRFGRRTIAFADDSWATRRERVIEFCEGVLSRGIKAEFWAQCRVDDLYRDRDLFPLMRRAGFYGMLVGFESAQQGDLDRWRKNVEASKALELGPELARHFQSVIGTFFVGDWHHTVADFDHIQRLCRELQVDIFIESPLNLFPTTVPIWKRYQSRPDFDMTWDYDIHGSGKLLLPTQNLTVAQVEAYQRRNMASFYGDPRKLAHALSSGPHAARQFLTMGITVIEDALRQKLAPLSRAVAAGDENAHARQAIKERQLALAQWSAREGRVAATAERAGAADNVVPEVA